MCGFLKPDIPAPPPPPPPAPPPAKPKTEVNVDANKLKRNRRKSTGRGSLIRTAMASLGGSSGGSGVSS